MTDYYWLYGDWLCQLTGLWSAAAISYDNWLSACNDWQWLVDTTGYYITLWQWPTSWLWLLTITGWLRLLGYDHLCMTWHMICEWCNVWNYCHSFPLVQVGTLIVPSVAFSFYRHFIPVRFSLRAFFVKLYFVRFDRLSDLLARTGNDLLALTGMICKDCPAALSNDNWQWSARPPVSRQWSLSYNKLYCGNDNWLLKLLTFRQW